MSQEQHWQTVGQWEEYFEGSAATELTANQLRKSYDYNALTGKFTRRISRNGMRAGADAGTIEQSGYIRIMVSGTRYPAHRLAWLYVYGEWPIGEIDHINGDPADNRITNLRDVTHAVNQQNHRHRSNKNTSKLLGVTWDVSRNRWRTRIKLNGVETFLGHFLLETEAHNAYLSAKLKMHPGFINQFTGQPVAFESGATRNVNGNQKSTAHEGETPFGHCSPQRSGEDVQRATDGLRAWRQGRAD